MVSPKRGDTTKRGSVNPRASSRVRVNLTLINRDLVEPDICYLHMYQAIYIYLSIDLDVHTYHT